MALFTPSISTSVSNGVLTVTDTSNYNTNEQGYLKEDLYVRTITVKDNILGINSVTKSLTYGRDSADFQLDLIGTVSVVVTLYQYGKGTSYNFSTDFQKFLNI